CHKCPMGTLARFQISSLAKPRGRKAGLPGQRGRRESASKTPTSQVTKTASTGTSVVATTDHFRNHEGTHFHQWPRWCRPGKRARRGSREFRLSWTEPASRGTRCLRSDWWYKRSRITAISKCLGVPL